MWTYHLPNAPPLNSITLELNVNTCTLEDTNIHTIVLNGLKMGKYDISTDSFFRY